MLYHVISTVLLIWEPLRICYWQFSSDTLEASFWCNQLPKVEVPCTEIITLRCHKLPHTTFKIHEYFCNFSWSTSWCLMIWEFPFWNFQTKRYEAQDFCNQVPLIGEADQFCFHFRVSPPEISTTAPSAVSKSQLCSPVVTLHDHRNIPWWSLVQCFGRWMVPYKATWDIRGHPKTPLRRYPPNVRFSSGCVWLVAWNLGLSRKVSQGLDMIPSCYPTSDLFYCWFYDISWFGRCDDDPGARPFSWPNYCADCRRNIKKRWFVWVPTTKSWKLCWCRGQIW